VLLIALARLMAPAAPPIYDGIVPPAPPYHYQSPPADLSSGNVQPSAGSKTLAAPNGANEVGTAETADQQLVVYFNQGVLVSSGATSIVVKLQPASDPPPPPKGTTMVGNDYRMSALGEPGDLPVTMQGEAQILLQVPPVAFTNGELYYAGAWHDLQMTVEPPRINVAVDHLGDLAVFEKPNAPQHQGRPGISWLAVLDTVVVAAALVVIAAVIWRRVRSGAQTQS
jgi:hypothetical protein